jgi:hypothetical protein
MSDLPSSLASGACREVIDAAVGLALPHLLTEESRPRLPDRPEEANALAALAGRFRASPLPPESAPLPF